MQILEFTKIENKWYVVLENWTGNFEDLEMVNGADTFLELLASKIEKNRLALKVWTAKPDEPCGKLQMIHSDGDGATYQVENCSFYTSTVWLCNVTKFVFGGFHPATIYFKLKV